jgi:capsular polysaccharide transport system permease protein
MPVNKAAYSLTPWQAIRIQARVLWALLLREASLRLGAYKFGHVFVLAEMLWGVMVLGVIRYILGFPPPYGTSVIFYIFTAMFPFTLYRTLHERVSAALGANQSLLIYPVIRPVDTMIARMALDSAFQMTAFILFYTTFAWLGLAALPAHPVELLGAISATILLGFGMGVTGMILRSLWKAWKTVDNMIARALFFVSGIFFQVEYAPAYIRDILVWNPLVHAIEWIRYCIYPNYFTQILDREYLLAWGLVTTLFGLGMERILRARLLEGR